MDVTTPPLVAAATARASQAGFSFSCDPAVSRLLAVLAAHLPAGARVLELGTGTGVGAAWITSALLPRNWLTRFSRELGDRHPDVPDVTRFREQLRDYFRKAAPARLGDL